MKRNQLKRLMIAPLLIVFMLLLATPVSRAKSQPVADIFTFLPASDGILVVDARRLLNETLPRVFAGDAAKLKLDSDLNDFKVKTGIDPRAFDRVILGAHYVYPSANVTKVETVAIAQGKFDVKAIAAAGRATAKGNLREEKYRGATIMVFGVNDQMKLFGLFTMRVHELAVAALNVNTLAIGAPATVRAAIDAGRNRRKMNTELIALASHDPQAVVGFGGNLSPALLANLDLGMDVIAADVKSIQQIYGSIGDTSTDLSLNLVARTDSPAAAKNLNDTLVGLKQFGEAALAFSNMAPAKKALARGALDNLKITTRGNELEVRTQFAVASLASMIK